MDRRQETDVRILRSYHAVIAVIAVAVVALSVVVATATRSDGQSGSDSKLTVAIYTPTVQFANSAGRLSYVQGIAKAIGTNTGRRAEGLSFTSLSKLLSAKPDFAIIDAQCYASNMGWKLLASGRIGSGTSRPWALYSRLGSSLDDLRGKQLAYVKMGCNDNGYINNVMLESEVSGKFFGKRVGKTDLAGAVAEVATYKGAHAVFAPVGGRKGLTKVFDVGSIPGPAFVQLNSRLSGELADKVRRAVVGYGGSSAIDGWTGASDRPYRALRSSMGKRVKRGLFAAPEPVRIDPGEVLVEPGSLRDVSLPEIQQNFEKPPERQE